MKWESSFGPRTVQANMLASNRLHRPLQVRSGALGIGVNTQVMTAGRMLVFCLNDLMASVTQAPSGGRDEFTQATKNTLAGRVGYRCSNPDCREPTIGPSEDATSKVARTGDAAHITAASPNGPRYDAGLSSAQRKDLRNGIWLCKKHASLVDSNHSRYSVELLNEWKRRAEHFALLDQDASLNAESPAFFLYSLRIVTSDCEKEARRELSDWILDFFGDVGAKQVLTPEDRVIAENIMFEMALNAHRHEGVRSFTITSRRDNMSLEYESQTGYGIEDLKLEDVGYGGVDSVAMLEQETQGRINLNFKFADQISQWICSVVQLGYSDDPCAINLGSCSDTELVIFRSECVGCVQVHVHGHLNDHSSDNWVTARYVKELIDDGHQVIVHSAPGPMAGHLQETISKVLLGRSDKFKMSIHA